MKKIIAYTFALCIALGMVSFAVALPPGGGPVGGGTVPGGPFTVTTLTATTVNESNATAVDTYSNGVTISNTTAATNGHNAYSPSINLHGHGWKANATAASVGTDWLITNEPVNGAAAPTTNLTFRSSAADTPSYTNRMTLGSDGTLTLTAAPVLPTQTANYVYAGPTTGAAAAPTFRAIVDNDIPDNITISIAATATALASNPTDCSANQFATTIAANGNLTCAAITDADVPDTIVVSNYLPLAGGTMLGNLLFTDNTLDIGANGATRPRTGYFGTDVNVGGDVNATDDLTCNPATATVPGIGATSTTHDDSRNGLMLVNTTSTATGTTTQVSPAIQFTSHALDANASDPDKDDTWDWKMLNIPTSANTTYAALSFQVAKKAGTAAWGTYFSTFSLDNSGRLSVVSPGTVAQTSYYNSTTGYTVGSDGFDFQVDGNEAFLWLREASNMKFGTAGTERLQLNSTAATFAVPVTVTGAVSASTTTTTGTAASFGGGTPTAVVTKLTTDATVFHVWTAAVLAAESCVNVRASCSVIDKAATASHNSYDKETLCCNAAGTTACDAVTAVRELEVEAAWDMTILPCDAVAGSCLTADAPVVAITGEAAHNLNWKCSVNSYVLTNG